MERADRGWRALLYQRRLKTVYCKDKQQCPLLDACIKKWTADFSAAVQTD